MKVSVCCCSLNARFDTKVFVEALQHHNKGFDFEVVITHDNRCQDGSAEEFKNLAAKYKNVKVIEHSLKDTEDYFDWCLRRFRKKNLLTKEIRQKMDENFALWRAGELVDRSKGFLWQSSGILYNKAVEASTGEVVIVTPGDFLYLFKLADAYRYVKRNIRGNVFYASPPAIWARINNHPKEWIVKHTDEVHRGIGYNEKFRWDSRNTFRDFMGSKELADLNLPNFHKNHVSFATDNDFINRAERYCTDCGGQYLVRFNPKFHGYHIMTRETFNNIGGFSEEWPHRAFADDKMTTQGTMAYGHHEMPPRFSVAWIGQYELLPTTGPQYKDGWREQLPLVDEHWDTHPIPPGIARTYLYKGAAGDAQMARMVGGQFNKKDKVVRFR